MAWDGVNLQHAAGYCTHDIVLFPTWHRPYLALFEQVLYGIVQEVAKELTEDQTTYVAAAKTFRMPYWDWAAPPQGGQVYPSFFKGTFAGTQSYLDLQLPNGTKRIINPLYAYQFNPLSQSALPNNPVCVDIRKSYYGVLIVHSLIIGKVPRDIQPLMLGLRPAATTPWRLKYSNLSPPTVSGS